MFKGLSDREVAKVSALLGYKTPRQYVNGPRGFEIITFRDHYVASKQRERITQRSGIMYQQNGYLN